LWIRAADPDAARVQIREGSLGSHVSDGKGEQSGSLGSHARLPHGGVGDSQGLRPVAGAQGGGVGVTAGWSAHSRSPGRCNRLPALSPGVAGTSQPPARLSRPRPRLPCPSPHPRVHTRLALTPPPPYF
jgi:hypothetical protein